MHIAVLGATGAVGRTMLQVLAERGFPLDRLTLLASPRSAGAALSCGGREYRVGAPAEGCFDGVDVALFSAGADRSKQWADRAVEAGAVVVDNSSAWRMDPDVPLVVPEVNADALARLPKGIVANPNCSTIQIVLALRPLQLAAGLERVVLTTFQSVSGAGERGREALRLELEGTPGGGSPFSRPIAGNVVPQVGDIDDEGWTSEERKMIAEPRKILSLPDLSVAPTCVRVPVEVSHSVQMMVELEREITLEDAAAALSDAPGVVFSEDADSFPTAVEAAGHDEVFVGRLRVDPDRRRILHLWVVADNLRKGAATNAVQIAELVARA